MFILMYVLSYVGSANLLRHAEGATWLAIVVVRANDIRRESDLITSFKGLRLRRVHLAPISLIRIYFIRVSRLKFANKNIVGINPRLTDMQQI